MPSLPLRRALARPLAACLVALTVLASSVLVSSPASADDLVVVTPPVLPEHPRYGDTVTAPVTWSGDPGSVSWTWAVGGVPRPGSGSSFSPALGDIGKPLSVTVTARPPGRAAVTTSATSGPVVEGALDRVAVTVRGEAIVDHRLSATVDHPVPGGTYRFYWAYQPAGYDGDPHAIWPTAAEEGPTLDLGPWLVGRRLRVLAVVSKPGYQAAAGYSRTSAPVLPGTLATTVMLQGEARVGQTLVAQVLPYEPETHRYQWLRDGAAIAGATRALLRLTEADLGHVVRVRAESSDPGYANVATAWSAPMTVGAPPTRLRVRVPRTAPRGSLVRVVVRGLLPGEAFTVSVPHLRVRGRAGTTGRGSVSVPVGKRPGRRAVVVRGSYPDRSAKVHVRVRR